MCPVCAARGINAHKKFDFRTIKGKHINRFTILAEWGTTKWGGPLVLCRCICGNPSIQLRQHVTSGYIQGCGCLKSGDSLDEFVKDNDRANSDCYFYVATISNKYYKPGIASNLSYRNRAGENRYSSFDVISPKLCRSEAWAIEQAVLVKTMDARLTYIDEELEDWGGVTELRDPSKYNLDWYQHIFNDLLEELSELGWQELYEKYCKMTGVQKRN